MSDTGFASSATYKLDYSTFLIIKILSDRVYLMLAFLEYVFC